MTKANVPPNVTPNVSDIHTYTLRTLLRVYRRTDDGKNTIQYYKKVHYNLGYRVARVTVQYLQYEYSTNLNDILNEYWPTPSSIRRGSRED